MVDDGTMEVLPPLSTVWACMDTPSYMYADLQLGRVSIFFEVFQA